VRRQSKGNGWGWPCIISVVGSDGLPIVLERMDDAAVLAGVELAPGQSPHTKDVLDLVALCIRTRPGAWRQWLTE